MAEAPDLTRALMDLIAKAGGVERLVTPRGYPHLGVAIIDAVFSLRATYDTTVVPLVERYCNAAGVGWEHRFDPAVPLHGVHALLGFLGPMDSADRCTLLNHQVAPGTLVPKADVCVEVARKLADLDIDSTTDLASSVQQSVAAERSVRSVPGIGPAAWSYILNLSRVERSKPDTMVVRWVGKVTDQTVAQPEAAFAIEAAVANLAPDHPGLTVRAADHLVWRAASGRPLTD